MGWATTARPLGARSGVRPGTLSSTVFLSGAGSTTWNVNPHAGILDTQSPVAAGPYQYANDSAVSGTITAADATNPRIDIVYVIVNDTVQDGSGLRSGQILYLAGTPAATPDAPATPARGMTLVQINVPKATTGSPTMSWVAPYCVAAGGILPVYSQAERDALTKYSGLYVHRMDTDLLEHTDGTTWLQKPAQPAACRYYRAGAATLGASAFSDVLVDTKLFDYYTGGASFVSGVFTAPQTGLYDVRFGLGVVVGNNPQDFFATVATSGNTELSRGSRGNPRTMTAGDTLHSSGSDLVPLASGAQIKLRGYNGGGNAINIAASSADTFLTVALYG